MTVQGGQLARLRRERAREDLLGVSREIRALIEADAPLGGEWGEVTALAIEAGDLVAARRAAQRLTTSLPGHRDSWLWLAGCEAQLGDFESAIDIVRNQLAGAPDDPGLHRRAGRYLFEAGRPDEAAASYRRALAIDQSDALAWEGLARCRTFRSGDDEIAQMEEWRLGYGESTPAEKRGILSYALAKAYEDIGEYDVAARRVWEAAAFYRAGAPFDVAAHERGVDQILELYDDRLAGSQEEAGLIDSRPVFILAPPAAGASWLARVLAADPLAGALDRENALFWMSSSLLGDYNRADFERALADQSGEGVLAEVARTYLGYAGELAGEARRIADPASTAAISAGAMALCLPAAKFIHVSRRREDLAWALLKRRFPRARHWTYHADDIARVLRTEDRLIERWAALFPERFLSTSYEALAADPAGEVRRIAFFAGIDADAAASAAEAGRAIFQSDPVGVHERAGERFAPVRAALERAGLG